MPERSKKLRDVNSLAAAIVGEATGAPKRTRKAPPKPPEKNPAAVELGRLGGLKGGKARAAKLSPEQRSDIARKAAQIRWQRLS
ncbi:MAG: hypothetical protein EPO65_11405 [Dehalococcoidia bacterium]|nr:MAG: hypothetical protein EPO65_11405 [Dehalococcoidia bacterium]